MFSRLGLFVGGFTLEAAEAVAGLGLDLDVLDGLTALLEKSLVRQIEGRADDLRYTMLETIREAALDGLEGSGDSGSVVDRYVDFYLALVEAAEPHLRGSPQQWLDRLEQEHDNLRAVLTHLQASKDALRALRFAGAVWRLWSFRGYLAEGLQRMEAVLALDAAPSVARGKALNGFAALAIRAGAGGLAEKPVEEALALHQRLGDVSGIALSTFLKGLVLGHHGDFQGARRLFEETAAAFTKLGDDHYALLSLRSLGWAWDEIGEAARAQAVYDQALERARQLGNRRIEAMALDGLSRVAVRQSRYPDALALVGAAAPMWHLLGELPALSATLCVAARALAAVGRSEDSVRVLARAMILRKEIGASQNPWLSTLNAETTAATRTHLGEDTWSQVFADGNTLGVDEVVALAGRGAV